LSIYLLLTDNEICIYPNVMTFDDGLAVFWSE
jgi:hypothetical protein